jgi:hypothetical protein
MIDNVPLHARRNNGSVSVATTAGVISIKGFSLMHAAKMIGCGNIAIAMAMPL